MKLNHVLSLMGLFWLSMTIAGSSNAQQNGSSCNAALDVEKRFLNSSDKVNLCDAYGGNIILVVNTASRCGFTYQYEGLETLQQQFANSGFTVLGFPSNDFGGQEPGTEQQIQEFCRLTYKVGFPMFEKTKVVKSQAELLYENLGKLAGEFPQWNFHKYLFNKQGELVGSYPSQMKPEQLIPVIEDLL